MIVRKIAFCETITQVDRLLADHGYRDSIDTYLAITPEAAWRLRQKGIAYRKPEDFYDESDLCSLSQSVVDREAKWVGWLDEYLQQSISEFKQSDFCPALCHFYYLKVFIDELFMRSMILEQIFKGCLPDEVIYFTPNRPPEIEWDLFFRESVYSLLLPLFCQKWAVTATRLVDEAAKAGETSLLQRYAGLRAKVGKTVRAFVGASVWGPARLFAKHGWRYLFLNLRRMDRGNRKILLQPTYDVEPLWLLARRQSIHCQLWGGLTDQFMGSRNEMRGLGDRLTDLWVLVKSERNLWSLFECAGLDLSAAAEPRLRFWWEHAVPDTWQAFVAAQTSWRADRPAAIVLPLTAKPTEVAALHAARSLGIPTVICQHGGFVGSCEYLTWDLQDLRNADYLFAYGRGAADYFKGRSRRCAEPLAVPVSVGSARLDELRYRASKGRVRDVRNRLAENKDQPVVLYVPTIFYGYTRYLDGTYPDVPYFELQYEVSKLFQEFPNIRFVYKPFTGGADCFRNPIPEILLQGCPNCMVVRDIPLTELVWAADAIILDYPSTGLLEALLTEKKIVCYADNRFLRMTREARELLGKRALVSETPEDFLRELSRFLAAGDFTEEASPSRDFIKAYGTHLDDGRSAERAVEALLEIIRTHPNANHLHVSECGGALDTNVRLV